MAREMWDIEDSACEELAERLAGDGWTREPHDIIHEIADSSVPIYTADLMRLAADNITLATAEPELGPAFDGSSTPVNIIAANVFEAIEAKLWEKYRELEAEREEETDDSTEDGADGE